MEKLKPVFENFYFWCVLAETSYHIRPPPCLPPTPCLPWL